MLAWMAGAGVAGVPRCPPLPLRGSLRAPSTRSQRQAASGCLGFFFFFLTYLLFIIYLFIFDHTVWHVGS